MNKLLGYETFDGVTRANGYFSWENLRKKGKTSYTIEHEMNSAHSSEKRSNRKIIIYLYDESEFVWNREYNEIKTFGCCSRRRFGNPLTLIYRRRTVHSSSRKP